MIPAGFEPVLRELAPVRDRFAAAGHRLYLVGGTVRDLLAADGRTDFDLDATTPARPAEVKQLLKGWADALWTQGERFGTIGAMKRTVDPVTGAEVERIYEITTHRADSYDGATRKPTVEFADDIVADLSRRDFTVNAMAIELTAAEPALVDPFHGADDLRDRVLRTPLEPHVSFSDDPLRMLRAARFVARYQLVPVPELVAAIREMTARLEIVSAERIHAEMDKLVVAPQPAGGLAFLLDTGIAAHVLPELLAATPAIRAHTIAVVDAVPNDLRQVRMAALFHALGASAASTRLRAWKASNTDIEAVTTIVAQFTRWRDLADQHGAWTDPAVRRLVHGARGHVDDVFTLARVDASTAGDSVRLARLDALAAHIDELAAREPIDDFAPELDGAQVMELLGLAPGRDVGAALAHLQQVRLDRGLLGRGAVEALVRQWWRERA